MVALGVLSPVTNINFRNRWFHLNWRLIESNSYDFQQSLLRAFFDIPNWSLDYDDWYDSRSLGDRIHIELDEFTQSEIVTTCDDEDLNFLPN